jgi:hypothetical protein
MGIGGQSSRRERGTDEPDDVCCYAADDGAGEEEASHFDEDHDVRARKCEERRRGRNELSREMRRKEQ